MIIFETDCGEIKIKLHTKQTPATCENFLRYVEEGAYDNTIFHRVIDGFVIQGGGFDTDMLQRSTHEPIENEADKGESNKRGTLSMARTPNPHSASSQFFINLRDNNFLDFKSKDDEGFGYCVFGHVVEGMDVVEKISKAKTTSRAGHQDVPEVPIVLRHARIVEDD